jgi:hypothetical protein
MAYVNTMDGFIFSRGVLLFFGLNFLFLNGVDHFLASVHRACSLLSLACLIFCQCTDPGIINIRMKKPKKMSEKQQKVWDEHVSEKHDNLLCPPHAAWSSAVRGIVLDQDHYCPWVNSVIGLRSQRYFVQFLVYSSCVCMCTMLECYTIAWRCVGDCIVPPYFYVNMVAAVLFFMFTTSILKTLF